MNIALFLAEGFEEVEAITIIDLFRRVGYNVTTISITDKKEVAGSHNITVVADSIIKNESFNNTDMIFLPGGMPGTKNLSEKKELLELIRKFHTNNSYICAICAAPFVLDTAGILKDKNYTCYPGWSQKIKSGRYSEKSVVVDKNIITSRGLGTAIEMALTIVEIISGKPESEKLKTTIIYK